MDYVELLPSLFAIEAGVFCVQLAREAEPARVLAAIAAHARSHQRIFVGVTDPINPALGDR
ncbi:hypothetical protein [Micromonospora sp. NPDC023633]|uniref:hypothetical protein n=1 Tax=Micromonospora sp. NPDC023633 TaxID=3154320 RepID=UPI0034083F4C